MSLDSQPGESTSTVLVVACRSPKSPVTCRGARYRMLVVAGRCPSLRVDSGG
jgi:hypothetical protein